MTQPDRGGRRGAAAFALVIATVVAGLHASGARADGGYELPWAAGTSWQVGQGWNGSASHNNSISRYAYDFSLPDGTAVLAVKAGTVAYVKGDVPASSCGGQSETYNVNVVTLDHDDGTSTFYGHLSSVNVALGQRVGQGDTLGRSGKTGYTGCFAHLHFQRQGRSTTGVTDSIPIYFDEYPGEELAAGRHVTSQNAPGGPGSPTPAPTPDGEWSVSLSSSSGRVAVGADVEIVAQASRRLPRRRGLSVLIYEDGSVVQRCRSTTCSYTATHDAAGTHVFSARIAKPSGSKVKASSEDVTVVWE